MKRFAWIVYAFFLLAQGCVPRTLTMHDGLDTTVVDSATKAPILGAFVFLGHGASLLKGPALATSDASGRLKLNPETKVKLVMPITEGLVDQRLIVCKEGYEPNTVVWRSGWNADVSPSQLYQIKVVELTKSTTAESSGCKASW